MFIVQATNVWEFNAGLFDTFEKLIFYYKSLYSVDTRINENLKKCQPEPFGHFVYGFTFWQVDFLVEVDHFS